MFLKNSGQANCSGQTRNLWRTIIEHTVKHSLVIQVTRHSIKYQAYGNWFVCVNSVLVLFCRHLLWNCLFFIINIFLSFNIFLTLVFFLTYICCIFLLAISLNQFSRQTFWFLLNLLSPVCPMNSFYLVSGSSLRLALVSVSCFCFMIQHKHTALNSLFVPESLNVKWNII